MINLQKSEKLMVSESNIETFQIFLLKAAATAGGGILVSKYYRLLRRLYIFLKYLINLKDLIRGEFVKMSII
ncbi:MAG: hypothetical protein COX19_01325 [Desulfobacterales bacterium CG23_combo_of_CG06-09_8_20_14_all_51_8]|nr:MAG: hypothetical protein COX19_01325 [Desulfobacterales bacterium CG23_combo_of_CG06-09_8_20_14_all_51_8]